MTHDLVPWLRAQLDEDERICRATLWDDDASLGSGRWIAYDRGPRDGFREARWVVIDGADEGVVDSRPQAADDEAVTRHIAEHDPARVLREIDAKRAVVAAYAEVAENDVAEFEYARGWANALGFAVRQYALVYTDRPGYRDDWAP